MNRCGLPTKAVKEVIEHPHHHPVYIITAICVDFPQLLRMWNQRYDTIIRHGEDVIQTCGEDTRSSNSFLKTVGIGASSVLVLVHTPERIGFSPSSKLAHSRLTLLSYFLRHTCSGLHEVSAVWKAWGQSTTTTSWGSLTLTIDFDMECN